MNKAPLFAEFWDAYAVKRNRRRAEPAWNRLTAREKRAAIAGIPSYRAACQQQGIAMMYPQNYLRDHRWEDEDSPASHGEKREQSLPAPTPSVLDGMEQWG